jgi:hypothetical protein
MKDGSSDRKKRPKLFCLSDQNSKNFFGNLEIVTLFMKSKV